MPFDIGGFLMGAIGSLGRESHFDHLLKFAALVQLDQDVRPTEKFTIQVDLRNGRPVGIFLNALTHFLIRQNVTGLKGNAERI